MQDYYFCDFLFIFTPKSLNEKGLFGRNRVKPEQEMTEEKGGGRSQRRLKIALPREKNGLLSPVCFGRNA